MPDAIRETRRAVELDPLSLINNTRLGTMFLYEHRYDEALAQARHALELDSSYLPSRELAALDYASLNRCDEALAVIERGPAFNGQYRGTSGWIYAKCGRRAQALAEQEKLRADAKAGHSGSHYMLAMIDAALGHTEQAVAQLDSAYRDRDGSMFMLRADPVFDGLRSEPRVARLLEKLGLAS
jgi:tetratricopeptide (TPR) repeat protein